MKTGQNIQVGNRRQAWRAGSPGRAVFTAIILAVLAAAAWTLRAGVIDDFEGKVKNFSTAGFGTDYFQWGLTNGQLVISQARPVATPKNDQFLTYDNVYWGSPPLSPGNLEEGRTLELRMDLNHASADDLFLVLMCGGSNGGSDSGYVVLVDRNELALGKWRGDETLANFYWDTLTTTNENVTVRLALTKMDDSVVVAVKVVDKGNQQTVYERAFVDGPGKDGPATPPDPHGTGVWTADDGAPHVNFSYAGVGCWQIVPANPPPLEMLLDNLEYDLYDVPELKIEKGVCLSWSVTGTAFVLEAAPNVTGPWTPVEGAPATVDGRYQTWVLAGGKPKYFRLRVP